MNDLHVLNSNHILIFNIAFTFLEYIMKPKVLKDIVISHFSSGKKAPTIAKMLANKVHRDTVHRWIKDHENPQRVANRKPPGRQRTVRTKRLINCVKKRLSSTSKRKSTRKMAKDFKCCDATIYVTSCIKISVCGHTERSLFRS
jgi:hypothetical protein